MGVSFLSAASTTASSAAATVLPSFCIWPKWLTMLFQQVMLRELSWQALCATRACVCTGDPLAGVSDPAANLPLPRNLSLMLLRKVPRRNLLFASSPEEFAIQ